MINKESLEKFIADRLEGTSYFPVEVKVSANNEIKVDIDSFESIDIDFCIALTREIEEAFPREVEDYELEVGSAGLTSPFRVLKQYEKHLGKEVEVLARDGKKYIGTLTDVTPEKFVIKTTIKEKPEGAKRPVEREVMLSFPYSDVNRVQYHFTF